MTRLLIQNDVHFYTDIDARVQSYAINFNQQLTV